MSTNIRVYSLLNDFQCVLALISQHILNLIVLIQRVAIIRRQLSFLQN